MSLELLELFSQEQSCPKVEQPSLTFLKNKLRQIITKTLKYSNLDPLLAKQEVVVELVDNKAVLKGILKYLAFHFFNLFHPYFFYCVNAINNYFLICLILDTNIDISIRASCAIFM